MADMVHRPLKLGCTSLFRARICTDINVSSMSSCFDISYIISPVGLDFVSSKHWQKLA